MLKILGRTIEYTVLAGIVFVALLVLSSVLPIPGGTKTYVVQSGSMEPAIKTGAVVVVIPSESYGVGDVITFGRGRAEETPTTHRVVEARGQGETASFTTKGDANEEADNVAIPVRNVVGKVLFDIPYLGYAVAAAQKPLGFVALVVLPALIIIIDQIQTLIRELRKGREEDDKPGPVEEDGGSSDSGVSITQSPKRLRLHRTVVRISGTEKETPKRGKTQRKLLMPNN